MQDSGPKEALTKFFEDLYHLLDDRDDQGVITQKERRHWVTYWENLKMDCATGELVSERRLDNMLETFLSGKGTPDGITVEVLKALPDDWKTQLARSMSEMCLVMESPAEWMQSATLLDPKVIGATSLAKFRPVLHRIDCVHLGSKQQESQMVKREFESGKNEKRLASRNTRKSSYFHTDHGHDVANIGTDLERNRCVLETRGFLFGSDVLRRRCSDCVKIHGCSGDDGMRNHPRAGIRCSDGGRGEDWKSNAFDNVSLS